MKITVTDGDRAGARQIAERVARGMIDDAEIAEPSETGLESGTRRREKTGKTPPKRTKPTPRVA